MAKPSRARRSQSGSASPSRSSKSRRRSPLPQREKMNPSPVQESRVVQLQKVSRFNSAVVPKRQASRTENAGADVEKDRPKHPRESSSWRRSHVPRRSGSPRRPESPRHRADSPVRRRLDSSYCRGAGDTPPRMSPRGACRRRSRPSPPKSKWRPVSPGKGRAQSPPPKCFRSIWSPARRTPETENPRRTLPPALRRSSPSPPKRRPVSPGKGRARAPPPKCFRSVRSPARLTPETENLRRTPPPALRRSRPSPHKRRPVSPRKGRVPTPPPKRFRSSARVSPRRMHGCPGRRCSPSRLRNCSPPRRACSPNRRSLSRSFSPRRGRPPGRRRGRSSSYSDSRSPRKAYERKRQ